MSVKIIKLITIFGFLVSCGEKNRQNIISPAKKSGDAQANEENISKPTVKTPTKPAEAPETSEIAEEDVDSVDDAEIAEEDADLVDDTEIAEEDADLVDDTEISEEDADAEIVDVEENKNPCASIGADGTWVLVPGDAAFNTVDFCVMKFEAKEGANELPHSNANQKPWVLNQSQAVEKCQLAGFSLISNNQWMTMAKNIMSVDSNWSGGQMGVGEINSGISDANEACQSFGDDMVYVDENCNPLAVTGAFNTKRSHMLNNGLIVHDAAGNIDEFVSDTGMMKPRVVTIQGQIRNESNGEGENESAEMAIAYEFNYSLINYTNDYPVDSFLTQEAIAAGTNLPIP